MIDFENLPKVVSITGSRKWTKDSWIKVAVTKLKPNTIVVSGGAIGVDALARTFALNRQQRTNDCFYKEFAVEDFEWDAFGIRAGHERNEDIARYLSKHKGHALIFTFQSDIDAEKGGSFNMWECCQTLNVPSTLILV
jgi:hypothetical protein